MSLAPRRPRSPGGTTVALAAAAVLVAAGPGSAVAQEDPGAAGIPRIPAGVAGVLLPVQDAAPLPDGSWPAGAGSRGEVLEAMNAELQFALSEEEDAVGWTPPLSAVAGARRNPSLGVDPAGVAADGLAGLEAGDRVPEPLHGQLRRTAALFGARFVLLPVRLRVRDAEGGRDVGGREAEGEPPGGEAAAARSSREDGRAALELALVDVRRGVMLWTGELSGEVRKVQSPAVLATLAARVADELTP